MHTSFPPLPQRPNRLHSLLFCLLLGVLSIIAAEVVSGSNRFPFVGPDGINVMGWLITYPVYLLHTVFLAGLIARADRTSWRSLLFAGAVFALYECYIMKVLWDPFWSPEFALMFAGISWSHFVMLITWWHPLMAFVLPILLAEMFLVREPLFLKGLPEWLQGKPSERRSAKRIVGAVVVFVGVCGIVGQPPWLGLPALAAHGLLILFFFWLWRALGYHRRFTMRDLLPGPFGLTVCGLLLVALYAWATPNIMPERLPGLTGHLTVIGLYVLFIAFIVIDRPVISTPHDPVMAHFPLASLRPLFFGLLLALVAGLPFIFLGPWTVLLYLLHWWVISPVCGLPLYFAAFVSALRSRMGPLAPADTAHMERMGGGPQEAGVHISPQ